MYFLLFNASCLKGIDYHDYRRMYVGSDYVAEQWQKVNCETETGNIFKKGHFSLTPCIALLSLFFKKPFFVVHQSSISTFFYLQHGSDIHDIYMYVFHGFVPTVHEMIEL